MATVQPGPVRPRPDGPVRTRAPDFSMQVSTYDNVSSLLVALLWFVGFFVLLMFLLWLTTVLVFSEQAVEVEWVEEPAGRGDHAEGYERDLEPPGMEELQELEEPQMEVLLEAVTDMVTSQLAALDSFQTDATITGEGSGRGDSRAAGEAGEGVDTIPRWERWQIQFAADNLNTYKRQLDYFEIELGALGGGRPLIDYASKFSQGSPARRQGPGDQEKRLYMTWTSAGSALRRADLTLLRQAGVPTSGRSPFQFYPQKTEDKLAAAEEIYAKTKLGLKGFHEIRKTVFAVEPIRGGYKFTVVAMVKRY